MTRLHRIRAFALTMAMLTKEGVGGRTKSYAMLP